MENGIEFIFQIIDVIFITIFVIADIVKMFMPRLDITSGIILFALTFGMVFLMMKLIEKEIIFKGLLFVISIFIFFWLLKRVEIINEVTAYTSSLIVGIVLLLATASFISLDEEGHEYV